MEVAFRIVTFSGTVAGRPEQHFYVYYIPLSLRTLPYRHPALREFSHVPPENKIWSGGLRLAHLKWGKIFTLFSQGRAILPSPDREGA